MHFLSNQIIKRGDAFKLQIGGDIVRQVKTEIQDGCKEIWLTSTDNGCYGFDIGTDFASLVNTVSEIPEGLYD